MSIIKHEYVIHLLVVVVVFVVLSTSAIAQYV